jgi:hypothetical protein
MTSHIPTEVELIYEVIPCNSLRCSQEPVAQPHPCSYFRKWGTYHSYDYLTDGAPNNKSIQQPTEYLGKAYLVPEVLSGCRKAPILALGINPNLAAFWEGKRNSIYPLFDDYKQYAQYFRYRGTAKLEIPEAEYLKDGGGKDDTPFSNKDLTIAPDAQGKKIIPTELQQQAMYLAYQGLLDSVAKKMKWKNHNLSVGEDISYGNMVACASAKWITEADPNQPDMPPMTTAEKDGIVNECFFKRAYFLRQLLQSLPKIVLIFSQTTANAFISTFKNSFIEGNPLPGESLEQLIDRKITLKLGTLPDNTPAIARIIFAPHITGNPSEFKKARRKIVAQLYEEAQKGNIRYNANTKHLKRTLGSCSFCPMMDIGKCDYEEEMLSLSREKVSPVLSHNLIQEDKLHQHKMLKDLEQLNYTSPAWNSAD